MPSHSTHQNSVAKKLMTNKTTTTGIEIPAERLKVAPLGLLVSKAKLSFKSYPSI
ncbi:hypothetical protein M527_12790 [Sphingobium indicum IP26]|nr:hypothetical protein M527_29045 [Sphingobium indicum IP26]EPR18364.1 hypothetical protein M527_12790 [Sphingobium indicum IP26]EQB03648.1 hypothetical protein L286_11520 [Sphingobium sp. HDIP04]